MTAVKKAKKPFSSLTPAQKRVAIAKDTLKWIAKSNIKVKTGLYFYGDTEGIKVKRGQDLQELLPVLKCKVCAKGALFLAHVAKFDNCRINKPYDIGYGEKSIIRRLKDIFSMEQLDMIETAFEEKVIRDHTKTLREYNMNDDYNGIAIRCIEFGSRYKIPHNRLKAILNNIIKNKGIFIP